MTLTKICYLLFAICFLIYLILPGPNSVFDFTPLPNSLKSDEPGDTVQVPNIVAYFGHTFREFNVNMYRNQLQKLDGLIFPPLRLNHPPEYSWEVVLNQVRSTYLEELVYPMRESLYVNGFEPHFEDGTPRYQGAPPIHVGEVEFDTKTTIRYYPSPVWARIIVWFGITLGIYLLWITGKKVIFND